PPSEVSRRGGPRSPRFPSLSLQGPAPRRAIFVSGDPSMTSDPQPGHDQAIQLPVHVAIYEHRHGTDVRVFLDCEEAMKWRTNLALEWWSDAFDDDPPAIEQIGGEYFDRMMERDE